MSMSKIQLVVQEPPGRLSTPFRMETMEPLPSASSYRDQAGNSGAIVTSPDLNNSITMDTEDPILSQVKISLITDNISLAKEGDVVYLHFDATEELINPIVTIMGEEKILDDQGTDWITSYLVRTNDEFNPYVSTPVGPGPCSIFSIQWEC